MEKLFNEAVEKPVIKKLPKSILNATSGIKTLKELDGYQIVNVSKYSKDELGKALTYGTMFRPVNTVIGRITNVRVAMDYISTPGYPRALLSKKRLRYEDIKTVPKKKISVPNFWAITMHFVWERIIGDRKLINDILALEHKHEFTSFNVYTNEVRNEVTETIYYNANMKRYLGILRILTRVIREEKESNWNAIVYEYILKAKDRPDLKVTADTAVEINTTIFGD